MIYLGDNKIGKIYLGDIEIGKIYLGNDLVYQAGGPPTPPPTPPTPPPIPTGAIACELVYSTGYTSFVDTSFVPASFNVSIDAEVCWSSGDDAFALGYYRSNPVERFNPISKTTNTEFFVGLGNANTGGTYPVSNIRVFWCRMRVAANSSGATIETYDKDGNLLNRDTITYENTVLTPCGWSIGLLGRKTSATGIASGSFRGGLGRTKIYSDDHFGTLAADYIPCYYNNNFGFWDNVAEEFLTGNEPGDIFGTGAAWNTSGWFPNARNYNQTTYANRLQSYRGTNTSPEYPIPSGCTDIRFNAGVVEASNNYAIHFYSSSHTYVSYFNYNAEDREVTVPNNAAYIRMSVPRGYEGTSYIYDMTHGKYIWKGINVI